MGQSQELLTTLLCTEGVVTSNSLGYPKIDDIRRTGLMPEVTRVYKQLGGVLDDFELNLRSWDIEFNGMAVELDEKLHFNRYRHQTLRSPLYAQLPAFPLSAYCRYCSTYEAQCLSAGSYGGKWSNSSTERQFGPPGKCKDLATLGAPRWKQRAFYDFVKDLSPLVIGVDVVRIAFWDTIAEAGARRNVIEVLKRPSPESGSGFAELIRERCPTVSRSGLTRTRACQ